MKYFYVTLDYETCCEYETFEMAVKATDSKDAENKARLYAKYNSDLDTVSFRVFVIELAFADNDVAPVMHDSGMK
jgi:hypothetical protein